MSSNSQINRFKESILALETEALAFPWAESTYYQFWLSQTYYIVRHTSHFIALAAGLIPVENRKEHYNMIDHLKDEENHDLSLIHDMKYFNKHINDFPELPETSLVWQNLYYWLSLRKPRSILGHSLCIEGLAAKSGEKLLPLLREHYPPGAITFLTLHFDKDKEHFEDGLELIKHFSEKDLEEISVVQKQSSILYSNMLRAIVQYVNSNSKRTAA